MSRPGAEPMMNKLHLSPRRASDLAGLIVGLGRAIDQVPVAKELHEYFGLVLPKFQDHLTSCNEACPLEIDPAQKRQLARFIEYYANAEQTGQDASVFAFELQEAFGLKLAGWTFHCSPRLPHAYRFTRDEWRLRQYEEPAEEAAR